MLCQETACVKKPMKSHNNKPGEYQTRATN